MGRFCGGWAWGGCKRRSEKSEARSGKETGGQGQTRMSAPPIGVVRLAFEVEGAEVGAGVDALDEFDEEPGGGVEVGERDDLDLGVHVALGDSDGGGGDAGVGDLDHSGVIGGG